MGAGGVVLLIVVIALAIAAVLGVILVAVRRWLRGRTDELATMMRSEAISAGERIALGPQPGLYRGGDPPFPQVKGNAVLMLTDRRLECRMAVGTSITVPAVEIAGAREERWFRGSAVGGQTHVVVSTTTGTQLGFFVSDPQRWIAALTPVPRTPA